MKHCIYLLLVVLTHQAWAQEFMDNKTMEFSADGLQQIHLLNHRGKVKITGSDRNDVVLQVHRKLKSASQERLDEAIEEIYFDSVLEDGHLYLYVHHPDRVFQINLEGEGEYESRNWTNRSNKDHFQIMDEFDLELAMPARLALQAVNHEELLEIHGVRGELKVRNHHDDLLVRGAGANIDAASHHGDVKIDFVKNPSNYLNAKSHHGDIRVSLLRPLSAEVSLKSHHGSFFTAFDWVPMPLQVVNRETERGTK